MTKHAQLCVDDDICCLVKPSSWSRTELLSADQGDRKVCADVGACAENETEACRSTSISLREKAGAGVVDDGFHLHIESLSLAC